jgi:hypothetical protein
MSKEEIREQIDERNAFKAMEKEFSYESRKVKQKEKPYKDVYTKSKFMKARYDSKTLNAFREHVSILNTNVKP